MNALTLLFLAFLASGALVGVALLRRNVRHVQAHRDFLTITKAPNVAWDAILPKAIDILSTDLA